MRAFVNDGFVALVCAQCDGERSRAPETLASIRRRYAAWFFDGDLLAAQTTDPQRWKLLDDAIALRFDELPSASEG